MGVYCSVLQRGKANVILYVVIIIIIIIIIIICHTGLLTGVSKSV